MAQRFSWDSPSSRVVLSATLRVLAELGYAGLTVSEIQARAGAPGALLEDDDLENLVATALQHVRLFSAPAPTGSLRGDLRALLHPWLGSRGPDERVVAAVLSASEWSPRLRVAVVAAFDRPLAQAVGTVLARVDADGDVPPTRVQTLNWILRSLALDRLRAAHPRSPVDLDELVTHLVVGLQPDRHETRR
jgi:AcrR family transcriptional regulator